jgi:hypothetical protein
MGAVARYYLETSSIRKAVRGLQDIASMPYCFTSAFVLFELVTELTESDREFNVRKACIMKLLDSDKQSKIRIEWLLPDDRLKAAFPILENKPDPIGKFYRILECVKDSMDSQQFKSLLADRQLTDYFEWLVREHTDITGNVQSAIMEGDTSWRPEANAIINKNQPNAAKAEREQMMTTKIRKLARTYWSATVNWRLVEDLARKCAPNADELQLRRITKSYDGSLNQFMVALDLAILIYKLEGYAAGTNDFADLLHLMYLGDGDVLVSEEGDNKLITRVACEVGMLVQRIGSLQGSRDGE